MTKYKLYYFDTEGRAEPIRLLFAYAEIPYDDVRISYQDWPSEKESMPYKQMPVLEVDGRRYCQSLAIIRYLAREFGLTGKDSLTQAKADEFAEACNEVMTKLHIAEKSEDKKEEMMQVVLEKTIPEILSLIEANMEGEFYAGELTYADVIFSYGISFLIEHRPDLLDATPRLKALRKKVFELPTIAKYIARRNGGCNGILH